MLQGDLGSSDEVKALNAEMHTPQDLYTRRLEADKVFILGKATLGIAVPTVTSSIFVLFFVLNWRVRGCSTYCFLEFKAENQIKPGQVSSRGENSTAYLERSIASKS